MAEDTNRDILLRKILVAIDPSSHSHAALEAAAVLAKTLEAQIHGLFVQDEVWKKVSRIPSSSIINEITGTIHPLEQDALENQLEMLKKRLRRRLETISRKNRIKHTWESVQGKVENKILEAAKQADLLTIGRRGSSFPRKKQLGSSAKAIIRKSDKPILILRQGLHLGANICVLYDASEESQRAIRLALSLAQKNESTLTVLVADNNPEAVDERSRELEKELEKARVSTSVKLLKNTRAWSFLNLMHNIDSGLLVIPKQQPIIQKNLETVLDRIKCPMLLMC